MTTSRRAFSLLLIGLAIGISHAVIAARSEAVPADLQDSSIEWPTHFEGLPLEPLPLSEREVAFAEGFPGALGRFKNGDRQVILRLVRRPTRKLHPSSDCLRAGGFEIGEITTRDGWRCYEANRSGNASQVRERIEGPDGTTWPEVSAWHWDSTWGKAGTGPWLAVTVIE